MSGQYPRQDARVASISDAYSLACDLRDERTEVIEWDHHHDGERTPRRVDSADGEQLARDVAARTVYGTWYQEKETVKVDETPDGEPIDALEIRYVVVIEGETHELVIRENGHVTMRDGTPVPDTDRPDDLPELPTFG